MSISQLGGRPRAVTTHSYVLDTLRDGILNGRLPAGTRLIQAELATQLGVSITPVREALRDLAGEGLVVLDPHRGSTVRGLDLAEVQEIYEIRVTLEPLMVQRTIKGITPEQLDRAQALCQQMETTSDVSLWSELNRQFHAIFAEGDKDSRLAQILNGLRDSAAAYVSLSLNAHAGRKEESDAEHALLVELYRARDIGGAVDLTVRHLRATLASIQNTQERA